MRTPLLFISIAVSVLLTASTRAATAGKEIANKLDERRHAIELEATEMLRTNRVTGSYTTVWRQFEDAAIVALEQILPRHCPELTATNFDSGKTGREKNRLADLAIIIGDETIEVSIKAARKSGNPENDMGTFRDHPNRKKLFVASFTFWVRYEEAGNEIRCDRAFFDRTWRLVGKSSLVDGVKYRKKDGNMRPKPWAMFDSGESLWKTEDDFEAAVKRSEIFRANELIKEYLNDLSESDQQLLYEKLKKQFEKQNPANN